jgi:NAD-dependent deacetylase
MKEISNPHRSISAESGIKHFRDSDGLWEGHNVQDSSLHRRFYNPALVLDFLTKGEDN